MLLRLRVCQNPVDFIGNIFGIEAYIEMDMNCIN